MVSTVVGSNIKAPRKLTQKDLNALTQDSQPTLTDIFPTNVDDSAPVANLPSSVNMAAHAAALSPDGTTADAMINSYRQALSEDTLEGQSHTATGLFQQATSTAMSANSNSLLGVLANPNLSDAQKRAAANAVYDKTNEMYSPQNLLSTKALSKPVGLTDNAETDNTRYSMSGVVTNMNNAKQQIQNIYNKAMTVNDPSLARDAASLVMSLLPFTKSYMIAKMRSDLTGDPVKSYLKTFLNSGESIQFMKDYVNNLSPQEQVDASQKLADIVNNHSSILMVPNDSVRREVLQDTISGQGYNTPQKVTDNIGSWLDILFGASLAKGVSGKFVKGGASVEAETPDVIKNWKSNFDQNYNQTKAAGKELVPSAGGAGGPEVSVTDLGPAAPKQLPFNSYAKDPPPATTDMVVNDIKQDAVRSQVQPVSVYENLKDTNPEMARDSFDAALLDNTGEAAKAVSGTDRTDMVFGTMAPEIVHSDGSVRGKILSPDAMQQLRDSVPFDVMDMIAHDGKTQYVQAEKAAARALVVNQFESAIGFTPRGEMFQINPDLSKMTITPNGMDIIGVYGPRNNGFSNPFDAVEVGKFALRNTGYDENQLGLLRRVDGNYVPTSLDEIPRLKEAASVWTHATTGTGPVQAEAVSAKGGRFDLTDQPTTMDTRGYNLKDGQWIREVVAKDPNSDQIIGRLIYTNFDKPPSVRVEPNFQRKGVATAMLKMAKNQGGTLGDNITGEFANGAKATRTEEGQAFRTGNNPDSVYVYHKDLPFMDDYLVTVNHKYQVSAGDVGKSAEVTGAPGWKPMTVKLNYFDRFHFSGGHQGTFQGSILDPASMLDPTIVQSTVIGTDKATKIEKSLLNMISEFTDPFKRLPAKQQALVHSEILDANLMRRDHNVQKMYASGMSSEAVDAVKAWRNYWDVNWYLENQRFVKGLQSQGYKEFVHTASNTSFAVKELQKSKVSGGVNIYNPVTDVVEHMPAADVDLLYKNGGGIAALRRSFLMQDGTEVKYVAHRDDPKQGYTKEFGPNSQVLNYIPGYFHIGYKDPFHVVETVKDARGNVVYQHSVATAKDTKAAQLLVSRKKTLNPESDYHYRRAKELNTEARFDSDLDSAQAMGRVAFRHRGKLLEDGDSTITDLSNTHVRNPVETMVDSAVSVSKKIAMQDVVDAMEQRMLAQYGDYFPKDKFGQPYSPDDVRKIKYRDVGNQNQSEVANARRTYLYMSRFRTGYINILDDGIKEVFQNTADLFGKMGMSVPERGLRAMSDASLTRGLNSLTYYAYLGTAPLRQLLIQSNQALLLSALNPKWVASTKVFTQPMYLALRTLGMEADHPIAFALGQKAWGSDADKVYQQFARTGFATSLDHQSMVSGSVNDLAKNMIANSGNKALSTVTKPIHFGATILRKAGFDAGEFYNMVTAWSAHRDLAIQKGMNPLRDDVADKIAGAARNYTGNMNYAGDLDNNRNALSIVFKYTQNAQKLMLNMVTNRAIPWALKRNLAIVSLILFGTGSEFFYGSRLNSIKDENAREVVRQGSEGFILNKVLEVAFGGKSDIDWGNGLSPYNAYGTLDLIHGIFTRNIGTIIANTPSLSMMFGNNPRVANAVKDFARYTHLIDDYDTPTKFLDVANSFAKISSGYSALARAKYLIETNKKVSTSGTISPENYDKVNAIGVAMGFQTIQDAARYYVNNVMYQKKQDIINDTTTYYKDLKQHYTDQHLTGDELLYTQKMLNEAHRMGFLDTDLGRETFNKLLERDLKDGNAAMYNNVMANCPLFNKGDCESLIRTAPFGNEDDRNALLNLVDFVNKYKEPDYDGKK